MNEYTQEQIDRANSVSIADFLISHGEQLEKSGQEYRWKRHDSLTIRDNRWYRHSQGKGGYPVAFVMEFYGKSFPEAVKMLIGEEPSALIDHEICGKPLPSNRRSVSAPPDKTFHLPLKNENNDSIFRYLTEERRLGKDIVGAFIMSGDIYEDADHHNAVFVGRDKNGIPRFASCRGTHGKFRRDIAGSDKSYGFCYQSEGTQLFVFEAPIDLLSFICLYPKDWRKRNYCSLGGVSGGTMERILSERKDIDQVFLCLDSDDAGNKACTKLAEQIPGSVGVTRLIPAGKDWNDVLREKGSKEDRKYIVGTIVIRESKAEENVPIIRMSEVEPKEIKWLWYPYIPFGKITIIQGNPGEGKTTLALHIAAAVTNGKAAMGMKDDPKPANVIYQTAENGLGDIVKPRLIEAGADQSRVIVIDEQDRDLSLNDERIEKAIVQNDVKLLILDPLQAYLGVGTDMNRANEIRPIIRRLSETAGRTGCAILLIGHLNKAHGTQSLYRGLGSIDFYAAARSVLLVGRVKSSPEIRVIIHDKSSCCPEGKPSAFSLGDDGFRWIGDYDITADELLSGKSGNVKSKKEEAEYYILEMLSSGKEIPSKDILSFLSDMGISERTANEAKKNLGSKIKAFRTGNIWYWKLSGKDEQGNYFGGENEKVQGCN